MEDNENPGCTEDLRIITQELLNTAQALLEEIMEISEQCNHHYSLRSHKTEQRVCAATIQEDGETLVIDGFRFVDAASREDLGGQGTTQNN